MLIIEERGIFLSLVQFQCARFMKSTGVLSEMSYQTHPT